MKFVGRAIVGAAILCASSAALAMPATTFLAKAEALMAKGPLALFSSDVVLLKQEATQSATQLKAERLALLAQHRPTAYCPPAKSGIGSDELLASLRRIPAPELARMQFKDAFRHILAQKYPCSR